MIAKFEYAARSSLRSVGGDAQRALVEARGAADRREVVAGGGHDHDAVGARVGDRLLHVRDHAGDRERLDARQRAEAEVDDVGAVVDRPADAGGDVLERAALLTQHLDGEDVGVARDAGHADAVVGLRGGDAGHVRAVRVARAGGRAAGLPVAVAAAVRLGGAVDESGPADDLAVEVGMLEVDARVDDRDRRAGAGRGRPRLLGADLLRAPLEAPVLIGGGRGGGGEHE